MPRSGFQVPRARRRPDEGNERDLPSLEQVLVGSSTNRLRQPRAICDLHRCLWTVDHHSLLHVVVHLNRNPGVGQPYNPRRFPGHPVNTDSVAYSEQASALLTFLFD